MIKIKFKNNISEYKHLIEPVKNGNSFQPNYLDFENVSFYTQINISMKSFESFQNVGRAILIDENGAYSIFVNGMEVIQ